MTVHSTQLCALALTTTADTGVYTVPSGKRTIVKSILIANHAAAANRVFINFYNGATFLSQYVTSLAALGAAGESVILAPWVVLNAGQSLHVSSTQQPYYVTASGAELSL